MPNQDLQEVRETEEREINELKQKHAEAERKLREKRAEEIRKERDKRVAEIKKNEPKPGEGGYYSPPQKEGVIHQVREDFPAEEPPPGMSPEEQPLHTATGLHPGETADAAARRKAEGKPTTTSESDDEVDYSDYTVAELKDMAHKRGVDVHSDMLKDDIIKALKKADKEG